MKEIGELNLEEIELYIEAYQEKKEIELRELDFMNWVMGKYMTFAYHSPKKYPSENFMKRMEKPKEMTDDEMERKLERIFKIKQQQDGNNN